MRLTGVRVAEVADHLAAIWSFQGDVPARGSVLWTLYLTNPQGALCQLGYKLVDGQFSAQFVFDFGPATQLNFSEDADRSDSAVAARYPVSVLEGLGDDWSWRATLNVDGRDVSEIS